MENYSVKDIIIGYRKKYQEINRKLEYLKNLSVINDNKVKSYNYFLFKELHNNKIKVGCYFNIEKDLSSVINKIKDKTIDNKVGFLEKDKDNNYYMSNEYLAGTYDKNKYNNIVDEITNNDFINKIENFYITSDDDYIYYLSTDIDGIWLRVSKNNKLVCKLGYNSYKNVITYNKIKESDNLSLENALNIKFPKEQFSNYMQEIIENNNSDINIKRINNKNNKRLIRKKDNYKYKIK